MWGWSRVYVYWNLNNCLTTMQFFSNSGKDLFNSVTTTYIKTQVWSRLIKAINEFIKLVKHKFEPKNSEAVIESIKRWYLEDVARNRVQMYQGYIDYFGQQAVPNVWEHVSRKKYDPKSQTPTLPAGGSEQKRSFSISTQRQKKFLPLYHAVSYHGFNMRRHWRFIWKFLKLKRWRKFRKIRKWKGVFAVHRIYRRLRLGLFVFQRTMHKRIGCLKESTAAYMAYRLHLSPKSVGYQTNLLMRRVLPPGFDCQKAIEKLFSKLPKTRENFYIINNLSAFDLMMLSKESQSYIVSNFDKFCNDTTVLYKNVLYAWISKLTPSALPRVRAHKSIETGVYHSWRKRKPRYRYWSLQPELWPEEGEYTEVDAVDSRKGRKRRIWKKSFKYVMAGHSQAIIHKKCKTFRPRILARASVPPIKWFIARLVALDQIHVEPEELLKQFEINITPVMVRTILMQLRGYRALMPLIIHNHMVEAVKLPMELEVVPAIGRNKHISRLRTGHILSQRLATSAESYWSARSFTTTTIFSLYQYTRRPQFYQIETDPDETDELVDDFELEDWLVSRWNRKPIQLSPVPTPIQYENWGLYNLVTDWHSKWKFKWLSAHRNRCWQQLYLSRIQISKLIDDNSTVKLIMPIFSARAIRKIKTRQELDSLASLRQNLNYFDNTLRVIFLTGQFKNPDLISEHFARELVLNWKHSHTINMLKLLFSTFELYAGKSVGLINIGIYGKIEWSERTRFRILKLGEFEPTRRTFSSKLKYGFASADARIGSFGIRVGLISDNVNPISLKPR